MTNAESRMPNAECRAGSAFEEALLFLEERGGDGEESGGVRRAACGDEDAVERGFFGRGPGMIQRDGGGGLLEGGGVS
jgi:hypothetical protein